MYYSKSACQCKAKFGRESELDDYGIGSEAADGRRAAFEVQHNAIAVARGVKAPEILIVFKHMLAGIHAVVGIDLTCDAEPLAAAHGTYLNLRVFAYLLEKLLLLARLDSEPALIR